MVVLDRKDSIVTRDVLLNEVVPRSTSHFLCHPPILTPSGTEI